MLRVRYLNSVVVVFLVSLFFVGTGIATEESPARGSDSSSSSGSSPDKASRELLLGKHLDFVDSQDDISWFGLVIDCLKDYKKKRSKCKLILQRICSSVDARLFSVSSDEKRFVISLMGILLGCVESRDVVLLPGVADGTTVSGRNLFHNILDFILFCKASQPVLAGKPLLAVVFDVYSRCGEKINFYEYLNRRLYTI